MSDQTELFNDESATELKPRLNCTCRPDCPAEADEHDERCPVEADLKATFGF